MSKPRKMRAKASEGISDVAWALLTDAPTPESGEEGGWEVFAWQHMGWESLESSENTLERLWHEHEALIIEQWAATHPGTRPTAWWLWSSPDAKPGAILYQAIVPPVEEQREYLRRHGLLLQGEGA